MRTLRLAPAQADFDTRLIPVAALDRLDGITWSRLCQVAYPGQFYPSRGSRLTPRSWAFPCVYLGASDRTTVAEVWGDRFYAERARGGVIYTIVGSTADAYGFLRVAQLPELRLCDLTEAETMLAVGIDAGSLYAPDLTIPQGWAEVIARHPAAFDGIIYHSRLTGEDCVVLWQRPGGRALAGELVFAAAGPLRDAPAAYAVAATIGLRLCFVN